jgi:hypothetical protein
MGRSRPKTVSRAEVRFPAPRQCRLLADIVEKVGIAAGLKS